MTRFSVNIHINHVILFATTAVLNMDNTVVDQETLQALYENVSITTCCHTTWSWSFVFMVTTLTNILFNVASF